MPIGILVNVAAVVLGGLLGTKIGPKLGAEIREKLSTVFSICAMTMGVTSVVLMKNMPAVILSVILGLIIGHLIHLDSLIKAGGRKMGHSMAKLQGGSSDMDQETLALLITAIVLFCSSGTGIYGSMVSGMTGDHSILLAKSILDFPTAMIFACTLGILTCGIAVPQIIIFLMLFFLADFICPICTETMIGDFKACGGVLLLATGFRMMKVKDFPIADMIPAMVIVMPLSWVWTTYILPFVA